MNRTSILTGFPWNDLPPKSRVVDVGGGLGHITMTIARQYPELQYVVQDRHAVIPDTEKYWRTNFPQALDSGLHDITNPQPIHDAAVFFLRVVIHVFGRTSAIHILSNLRASATPDTKLVLIEQIIPYACPYNDVSGHPVAGTKDLFPSPPPPLVNFGRFTSLGYLLDLQMACALNAEERTFGTWVELCRAGGWNITQVYPIPGSRFSHIVAVPLQD
ncbi:S-adenosyl-L-methionine-dependent methyltransferase [Fistulina hepatica ATCC 64428]|uniref:S-adenosyl-L-methionine-dependent methyltransferase n=1 Tax=Fistulina hepatica ATCC 64428 TaxID=1128425 RepID=A0A0D7AB93_9AGAR|nr:S-adenosyl-L-methionine-dependent methyltransferase [Fistulina hepatica ATCC 64428]